jgi:hypothetical protein
MPTPRRAPAIAPSPAEQPTGPRERVLLAGAGVAATWVLAWLLVQLYGAAGWALPFLPGSR